MIAVTRNPDSDLWVYRHSRHIKFDVHFKNKKVNKVED